MKIVKSLKESRLLTKGVFETKMKQKNKKVGFVVFYQVHQAGTLSMIPGKPKIPG